MKKGVLSKEEKFDIVSLIQENKTVAEIAAQLDRSEESVEKYLEEVRIAVAEKPEPIQPGISEKVINYATNQLRQMGLTEVSINAKINKILKLLTPEQLEQLTGPALYGDCLRLINVHDVMINKTAGGNPGVSIMTEAGAERADSVKTNPKPSPHVYRIH